jgi:hypothetical protein
MSVSLGWRQPKRREARAIKGQAPFVVVVTHRGKGEVVTSVADDVDQVLEEEEDESVLDGLAQGDVLVAKDDVAADDEGLDPEDDLEADLDRANVTTARAEDEDDAENEDGGKDVEAGLDAVLRERVVGAEHQEDDQRTVEAANLSERTVLPRQPDEFVCGSCFLVKHHTQIADQEVLRCCDCVR